MTDDPIHRPGGGALRRMVRPAPRSRLAVAPDLAGLREAAPRVVHRVAGLGVTIGAQSLDTLDRDALGAALPEGALVFRLAPHVEGGAPAGLESTGLAWLGPDLFAALVERRLTGSVRREAAEPRPSTPIDAVICAELVDGLCAAQGPAAERMRTTGHLRDPDLAVVLGDLPFRVMRLTLRLMQGDGRGGEIGLALPEPQEPPEVEAPHASEARDDLMGCRADLSALLPPLSVPWERLVRLAPGDRIAVPADAIDAVRLEGIGGGRVSQGRLGRLQGMRAVRLRMPPAGGPSPDGLPGEGGLLLDAGREDAEAPAEDEAPAS